MSILFKRAFYDKTSYAEKGRQNTEVINDPKEIGGSYIFL